MGVEGEAQGLERGRLEVLVLPRPTLADGARLVGEDAAVLVDVQSGMSATGKWWEICLVYQL